jgi:hypothetical protein
MEGTAAEEGFPTRCACENDKERLGIAGFVIPACPESFFISALH